MSDITDKANAALESVYASGSNEDTAKAYADWATTYDSETASLGYALPFQVLSWVTRYVPAGQGPILDAGCGTGLSGPTLKVLGYDAIEGLDLSADMLKIAGGRGAYGKLTQAALGDPLPWADGHFRAVFSTGVFTIGHAPASGLYELARITRKGGHVIFTVRDQVLEPGGFRAVFADLARQGKWRLVEEAPWLRAYAIAEPDALVKPFVFEIT